VTDNDSSWNEYIKKGNEILTYNDSTYIDLLYLGRLLIETGLFQSKRVRSNMCRWSSSAFVRAMEKNITV
jgi:hypothetical protein